MSDVDVAYLVVGAGPVGLTAARLLANQGRPCLVAERREGPQRHPAAHVVNARTLEIFRQAGFDMHAIHDLAADPSDAGHVNYVTTLGGDLIGRLPFERQGPEVLEVTPTPLRNISQHRLEPLLAEEVAAMPTVDLRYETEWVSSVSDDDGVTSVLRDVVTDAQFEVRSRYLIAADGAGSRIRKAAGIDMIGPPSLESFVAIHFRADLREVIADRLGVLHFVMDPSVGGAFIGHDIDTEWVYMVSFDPAEESVDDYPPQRCTTLVANAIGVDGVPIEILSAGTWHMSAQVAQRMRDDRTFLVGDAAHRFPPTGGLGLNTGVADVHGLVWKLGAVDDHWAAPSLLDTYELERRPIAGINCEQSMTNAFKMLHLLEALGLTTNPTTEGLHAMLADPAKADGIAAAVDEQATHFDMIGLQLGYCYTEGALARVGATPGPDDDPRRFDPDAAVGTRLPHGWLGDGRSTLDLIAGDVMTVLSVDDHDSWAAATEQSPVPIIHLRIGVDIEVDPIWLKVCGLDTGGALLVRPDQHIAWRADSADTVALDKVLAQVLGTPA